MPSILRKMAEDNDGFFWDETNIQIRGNFATTEIEWKIHGQIKSYTVKIRLPSQVHRKEEVRELMEKQIDTTILLMSRYIYDDVARFNYNEKNQQLIRTFKQPKYHASEERVSEVDFLNPLESNKKRVKIKKLEERIKPTREKIAIQTEKYERNKEDEVGRKLGQTQDRLERIARTIEYGKFLNSHLIRLDAVDSGESLPLKRKKEEKEKEKEGDYGKESQSPLHPPLKKQRLEVKALDPQQKMETDVPLLSKKTKNESDIELLNDRLNQELGEIEHRLQRQPAELPDGNGSEKQIKRKDHGKGKLEDSKLKNMEEQNLRLIEEIKKLANFGQIDEEFDETINQTTDNLKSQNEQDLKLARLQDILEQIRIEQRENNDKFNKEKENLDKQIENLKSDQPQLLKTKEKLQKELQTSDEELDLLKRKLEENNLLSEKSKNEKAELLKNFEEQKEESRKLNENLKKESQNFLEKKQEFHRVIEELEQNRSGLLLQQQRIEERLEESENRLKESNQNKLGAVKDLEDKLAEKQSMIEELLKSKNGLEKKVKDLESQKNLIQEEFENFKEPSQKQIEDYKVRLNESEIKLKNMQLQLDEAARKGEKLAEENKILTQSIREKENEHIALDQKIEDLQGDLEKQKSAMGTLEKEKNSLVQEFENHKQQASKESKDLQRQIGELQSKSNELIETNSKIKKIADEDEKKLALQQQKIKQLENNINETESKLNELKAERHNVLVNLGQLSEENKDLKNQFQQLEKLKMSSEQETADKLKNLETQIQNKNEELQLLTNQLKQQRKELKLHFKTKNLEKIEELKKQNAENLQKIADFERELANLKNETEQKNKKLETVSRENLALGKSNQFNLDKLNNIKLINTKTIEEIENLKKFSENENKILEKYKAELLGLNNELIRKGDITKNLIDLIDQLSENIDDLISNNNLKINAYENTIAILTKQIAETKIANAEAMVELKPSQIPEFPNVEGLMDQISMLENAMNKLQLELDKNKEEKEKIFDKIGLLENDFKEHDLTEILDLILKLKLHHQEVGEFLETDSTRKEDWDRTFELIDKLSGNSEHEYENYFNELQEAQQGWARAKKHLKQAEEFIRESFARHRVHHEQRNQIERKLKSKIYRLTLENKKLESEIEKLKENQASSSHLKKKIKKKQRKLKAAKETNVSLKKEIEKAKNDTQELEDIIETLKKENKSLSSKILKIDKQLTTSKESAAAIAAEKDIELDAKLELLKGLEAELQRIKREVAESNLEKEETVSSLEIGRQQEMAEKLIRAQGVYESNQETLEEVEKFVGSMYDQLNTNPDQFETELRQLEGLLEKIKTLRFSVGD